MSIGPVQLIVLGFEHPEFHGEIIAELERLKESETVRVIDALAIYKDAAGELEVEHLSTLTREEAVETGSAIADLIGLDIEGEEAAELTDVLDSGDAWDVVEDIPDDTAAALLLIEHRWAMPLRDAIVRANGYRIADAFVSPFDLVEIGLLSAAHAQEHHAVETGGAATRN